MNPLQSHPFPVVAWFDRVVAVSFAFPEEVLRTFVPAGLEMDTYQGLGFVTVALVWTRHLRPAGLPQFLGRDFFLAGYRIFTRLPDESGRRLRGLRILRSETDRRIMVWSGNLFTGYHYRHVAVRLTEDGPISTVETARSDGTRSLLLRYDAHDPEAKLSFGSPFHHVGNRSASLDILWQGLDLLTDHEARSPAPLNRHCPDGAFPCINVLESNRLNLLSPGFVPCSRGAGAFTLTGTLAPTLGRHSHPMGRFHSQ